MISVCNCNEKLSFLLRRFTKKAGVSLFSLFLILTTPLLVSGQALPPASDLRSEVEELRGMVLKLQSRIDDLEARSNSPQTVLNAAAAPVLPRPLSSPTMEPPISPQLQAKQTDSKSPSTGALPDFLHGTTLNFLFDGYYGYNFNAPIGRDTVLRAYDVSSNSFSLNQAAVILENAPDPDKGKRFGARIDLQFGQATQTLQGNPANEARPDIYRNIFQLYGTYIAPVGHGLTLDFGKWASSIGLEGNYSKDQMNYSRSYWFDFLPFYHTGVRASYKVNDSLSLNYWIVNGTQQTEAFNNFKDQLFGLSFQARKSLSLTVNYYLGQEHPDTVYFPNSAPSNTALNLPTIQGVPFEPIQQAAKGKLHIFDSYVTWQTTPKLTLALEGDYVIQRQEINSAPLHTAGGAVYSRFQIVPNFAIAGRAEYLTDRGGLFSGTTQALKETTFTTEYRFADGFLMRGEWRRDSSNQPFFLTSVLGNLKKEQNTATVGLIWWFGKKTGTW